MGKEMRLRGWKKKYQEDEKEGRKKKKIFKHARTSVFFGPNSAPNNMHTG
jgi:hypothetical protein